MNFVYPTFFGLLFLVGTSALADPPPASPEVPADPLTEALPILQAKFLDFKTLNYKPGDTLSDLIVRSNGEISLLPPPGTGAIARPAPSAPVALPDNILYWRLAAFAPEKSWTETARQLQQLAPTTVGIVLDLRSGGAPDDYADAGQILGFFSPNDPSLGVHSVLLSSRSSFHCPIFVLTNVETAGAAEALAACLQGDGSIVMGRPTAGKMGRFEEQKLSSGQILRYLAAPVWNVPAGAVSTFPPHHDLPWGQPVTPDIGLNVNDRSEKAALTLIKDNRLFEVIGESPERRRMNEASLVQGQDPEWDDYLGTLERKPVLLSLPVVHDVVLISALDGLKAIRLSERAAPGPGTANASLPESSSVQ